MSEKYSKMKVIELKAELQKLKLPTSGNKDTLIKRLLESKENDGDQDPEESLNESEESPSEKEDDDELPDDISKMKVPELKAALKKRGLSVSGSKSVLVERLQGNLNGDAPSEKKGKRKASDEGEGKVKKRKTETSDDDNDNNKDNVQGDDFSKPERQRDELRIVTWNVAGFSAVMKKGFSQFLEREDADIICLNETKIGYVSEDKFPGYRSFFNSAKENAGYSGVAVITKVKPLNVDMGIGIQEHDNEGRCITMEFEDFYLVASYVPCSGTKAKGEDGWPERLDYRMSWDAAFQNYLRELDKKKPIVWCGDLNVAHEEIDLANPKSNKKHAGFTIKERQSFDKFLKSGFVDVHRHMNPNKKGCYSFWSYRSPKARKDNIGWRLDYFVVSERILPRVTQSYIRSSVLGSDHCPIGIHFKT